MIYRKMDGWMDRQIDRQIDKKIKDKHINFRLLTETNTCKCLHSYTLVYEDINIDVTLFMMNRYTYNIFLYILEKYVHKPV